MNAKEARLATLEAFFKLAAENPEVDFSAKANENEVEDVGFDPIRNIEEEADEEMKGQRGLFLASW
jgi:hypothetical protein